MKFAVFLASLLIGANVCAFSPEQSAADVATEVAQRKEQGQTADQIAAAAVNAGLPASVLAAVSTAITNSFPQNQRGTALSSLASAISVAAPTAAGPGFGGVGTISFGQNRGATIGGSGTKCVSKCG